MKFEIINYDVWGNSQDGFEVNAAYSTGIFVDISENDTDKTILKKLKEDPSQLDSSGMGDWFKLSQKDKLKIASLKKKKK